MPEKIEIVLVDESVPPVDQGTPPPVDNAAPQTDKSEPVPKTPNSATVPTEESTGKRDKIADDLRYEFLNLRSALSQLGEKFLPSNMSRWFDRILAATPDSIFGQQKRDDSTFVGQAASKLDDFLLFFLGDKKKKSPKAEQEAQQPTYTASIVQPEDEPAFTGTPNPTGYNPVGDIPSDSVYSKVVGRLDDILSFLRNRDRRGGPRTTPESGSGRSWTAKQSPDSVFTGTPNIEYQRTFNEVTNRGSVAGPAIGSATGSYSAGRIAQGATAPPTIPAPTAGRIVEGAVVGRAAPAAGGIAQGATTASASAPAAGRIVEGAVVGRMVARPVTAAAAQGAASGGSTIAATAARFGPAGIAVAGVVIALTGLAVATNKLMGLFSRQANELEQYSGAIAGAKAEIEANQEMRMLRRAEKIGPELASFELSKDRLNEAMFDATTAILGILVKVEPLISIGANAATVGVRSAETMIHLLTAIVEWQLNFKTAAAGSLVSAYGAFAQGTEAAKEMLGEKPENKTQLFILDHNPFAKANEAPNANAKVF